MHHPLATRAKALLAAMVAVLCATPALATQVALSRSPSGSTVEVLLDGNGPFRFAIQTASEYTFVSQEIIASLGLMSVGDGHPGTVKIEEVKLGDRKIANLEVRSIDPRFLSRGGSEALHGLMGWGVFRDEVVTLDFPRGKMILGQSGLDPEQDADLLVMKLNASVGSLDTGRILSVPITVGDVELQAELNSSSDTSMVFPEAMAGQLSLTGTPGVIGRARTPDGEFIIKGGALADSVHIGGLIVEVPRARFSDFYQHPGVGYELMREFTITMDHRNGRVRFAREAGVNDPQEVGAGQVPEVGGESRLRAAFNQDRGKVRLLMILSPT